MTRAHLYRPIQDSQGNLRLQAAVRVFDDASTTLTSEPLFAAEVGSTAVPNTFTTNSGIIDFYTDTPKRFRIGVRVADEPEVLFDGVDSLAPPEPDVDPTDALTLEGHPASYFYSPSSPPPGPGPGTVEFSQQTTDYTLTDSDSAVFFNGANLTATLPDPAGRVGRQFVIKNLNSTLLTVLGPIDADASVLLAQFDSLSLVSNGTIWGVV